MEFAHPLRVVTGTLDAAVLEILASADRGFSGREVARAAAASAEGVRGTLTRLAGQGIVTREPGGGAIVYRFNRDHLAAPAITALLRLREDLLERARDLIAGWSVPPDHAALFGSVARGQERTDSDLDVFLLRPAGIAPDDRSWREQVDDLERRLSRWTGMDARALEFGADERTEMASGTMVLDDVLQDGLTLAGDPGALRRLLRTARSGS